LARMGYEKPYDKLTFYKAFFSLQWKFLIHTILQCLSAKTTSWNEFSSTTTSAIISLATNQKFNFSRYILLSLVKNIEAGVPFFMFPSTKVSAAGFRLELKWYLINDGYADLVNMLVTILILLVFSFLDFINTTNGHQFTMSNRQERIGYSMANGNKLKGNSVDTKFAKTSVLGKSVLQSLRNQSVVRQPNAFKSERPQMSKPRFASQVDVNNHLSRPVTQHYFPKRRESVFAKPNHMIASSESRNSSKNMPRFSSNDMVHNHYLDEAKKKTQERDRNLKTSVMPLARFEALLMVANQNL
nr:glutamic acid-rich protein-like [Tanacetum cinerariifolium]